MNDDDPNKALPASQPFSAGHEGLSVAHSPPPSPPLAATPPPQQLPSSSPSLPGSDSAYIVKAALMDPQVLRSVDANIKKSTDSIRNASATFNQVNELMAKAHADYARDFRRAAAVIRSAKTELDKLTIKISEIESKLEQKYGWEQKSIP